MTNLFTRIDKALDEIKDGWCSVEKAHLLASCVCATRPSTIVEIGVWAGRSLIPMAMACKQMDHGKVIAIDPWRANASVIGMTGVDAEWWGKVDHEQIYQKFVASLKKWELEPYVSIWRTTSDEAAAIPHGGGPGSFIPRQIQMLHIDGNHSDQALRDVNNYAERITQGGIVFADDVNWAGGSVTRATDQLLHIGFQYCMSIDTGALFRRNYITHNARKKDYGIRTHGPATGWKQQQDNATADQESATV